MKYLARERESMFVVRAGAVSQVIVLKALDRSVKFKAVREVSYPVGFVLGFAFHEVLDGVVRTHKNVVIIILVLVDVVRVLAPNWVCMTIAP